jgi:hypothetical protein
MQRREFNPRGQFTVLRRFRLQGRDFQQGDLFPHRQLGVSTRLLRTLWDSRKLEMMDPFSKEAEEAEKAEMALEKEQELAALEAELDLDLDEEEGDEG